MRKIVVVGAGASGLMAACAAARAGASVTVLERMKKPGKKLLLTGSGRCNLSNLDPGLPCAYGGDGAFAAGIIGAYPVRETLAFFEEIGVSCTEQQGLVYPRSFQARTVLDALLRELSRLHVRMKYDTGVLSLSRKGEGGPFLLRTEGWTYEAGRVILCCGGMAAPSTGSDGSGYSLARMAGHSVTDVLPSLTALLVRDPDLSLAAGARTKAKASLFRGQACGGRTAPLFADSGEVQWLAEGLSGIVIFQLSRIAAGLIRGGESPQDLTLVLDLVPDLSLEMLREKLLLMLAHGGEALTPEVLLGAFTHERAAAFLAKKLRGPAVHRKTAIEKADLLSRALKARSFPLAGLRDFTQAQVTSGGIPPAELKPLTLESRIVPGLYFAGELLDVDGPCGGYNLQWAWSSGRTAGLMAASS